jgi:hypothetical protein
VKDARSLNNPILEFPLRQDRDWIQDFQVEEKHFKGKLYFYGYWEGFYINLERGAARRLGLKPGARMRIDTERLKIDGLFLDRTKLEDFIAYFEKKQIEDWMTPFKEFAFGGWKKTEGREILLFNRLKATRQVIERHLDRWIPAEVTILSERWRMPEPKEFGILEWTGKNEFKSNVITVTDLDALLNIRKSDLLDWNLEGGDLFKITCGKETRTLVFAKNEKTSQLYHFLTHRWDSNFDHSMQSMMDKGGRCFARTGKLLQKSYSGSLPVHWLPANEELPLVGYFDDFIGNEKYLRIRPMPVDGGVVSAPAWLREEIPVPPWSRAFQRGATVQLSR